MPLWAECRIFGKTLERLVLLVTVGGSLALVTSSFVQGGGAWPSPVEQTGFRHSPMPLSGTYRWEFEGAPGQLQRQHYTFHPDSIRVVMQGDLYNTRYVMLLDQYVEDGQERRWIGVGQGGSIPKDGKYFVLFLDEITEDTVMIYKHETNSREEAEAFPLPPKDAETDHGWNRFRRE